jgi:hypothetical protein
MYIQYVGESIVIMKKINFKILVDLHVVIPQNTKK